MTGDDDFKGVPQTGPSEGSELGRSEISDTSQSKGTQVWEDNSEGHGHFHDHIFKKNTFMNPRWAQISGNMSLWDIAKGRIQEACHSQTSAMSPVLLEALVGLPGTPEDLIEGPWKLLVSHNWEVYV